MRANPRAGTKPEQALRSALYRHGLRFRKDYPIKTDARIVRADVAFPGHRLAIFVDGCFWHRCPEHGNLPRTNQAYWTAKLMRNVARDRAVDEALRTAGWDVLRAWEHEQAEAVAELVARRLTRRQPEPRRGDPRFRRS